MHKFGIYQIAIFVTLLAVAPLSSAKITDDCRKLLGGISVTIAYAKLGSYKRVRDTSRMFRPGYHDDPLGRVVSLAQLVADGKTAANGSIPIQFYDMLVAIKGSSWEKLGKIEQNELILPKEMARIESIKSLMGKHPEEFEKLATTPRIVRKNEARNYSGDIVVIDKQKALLTRNYEVFDARVHSYRKGRGKPSGFGFTTFDPDNLFDETHPGLRSEIIGKEVLIEVSEKSFVHGIFKGSIDNQWQVLVINDPARDKTFILPVERVWEEGIYFKE